MKTQILVRAKPYRCQHRVLGFPYWAHRAYEVEIVGHGWTMAPSKKKIREWALDWLTCADDIDPSDYEVEIEWF